MLRGYKLLDASPDVELEVPSLESTAIALPPEIWDNICERLAPEERSFTNPDLLNLSQVSRTLNASARRLLFRHLTITCTLKDDLPADPQPQNWQPHAWKTPDVLRLLEKKPKLREHVQSVRLRTYPWPVEEWTDERFDDDLLKRLDADLRARRWRGRYPESRRRDAEEDHEKRQAFVTSAYGDLNERRRPRDAEVSDVQFVQDLAIPCRGALAKLRKLSHIEAVHIDASFNSPFDQDAANEAAIYAEHIALRAAPAWVRSIGLPAFPPEIDHDEYVYTTPEAAQREQLQDLRRIGPQSNALSFTFAKSSVHPAVDAWVQGLRHFSNLTTLSFSADALSFSATFRSNQLMLDPFLDDDILVLDHVKTLTLTRWKIQPTNFRKKIQARLPVLTALNLNDVAMVCTHEAYGKQLWLDHADELKQLGKLIVACERPGVCGRRTGRGLMSFRIGEAEWLKPVKDEAAIKKRFSRS